jgi:hypothetical protein
MVRQSFVSRAIGQRELRNDNATVMAAVARWRDVHRDRNGTPLAELRPLQQRPHFVSCPALLEAAGR